MLTLTQPSPLSEPCNRAVPVVAEIAVLGCFISKSSSRAT